MDGVVTNLLKEEGEVVIGAQSFQPTVIMTVADLSVMEVRGAGGRDGHPQRHAGPGGRGPRGRARRARRSRARSPRSASSAIAARQPAAGTQASHATTANQAKDFKVVGHAQGPAVQPAPGPQRHRRTSRTDAQGAGAWPCPSRPWWCARSTRKGKVVDPAMPPGAGEPDDRRAATAREKRRGEGRRVRGDERARRDFQAGQDRASWARPTSRSSRASSEGDEIVTGSYKTLRTLKDEARIKIEARRSKSVRSARGHSGTRRAAATGGRR